VRGKSLWHGGGVDAVRDLPFAVELNDHPVRGGQ